MKKHKNSLKSISALMLSVTALTVALTAALTSGVATANAQEVTLKMQPILASASRRARKNSLPMGRQS